MKGVSFICTVTMFNTSFMPVIYITLHAIFQPNGSHIDFFMIIWDQYFMFGFLCLIKPDSDRITISEHFISK